MHFFSTKLNKFYNIALQVSIVVFTYYYIYRHVFNHNQFLQLKNIFYSYFNFHNPNFYLFFIFLLLLMLLNWSIETIKWMALIKKIEKIPFLRAFSAVLSGITVSTFLPNRSGEYLGRVFIFERANRIQGVLITIIGSISQLLVTILLGLFALFFVFRHYVFSASFSFFISGTPLVIAVGIIALTIISVCMFFYFNLASLSYFVRRIKLFHHLRLARYFRVFLFYSNYELFKILVYSFFRYLVFALQFFIILRFFGIFIPLHDAFIFICSVFFFTTLIPTIVITDPGVRGAVAIAVYTFYMSGFLTQSDFVNLRIIASSTLLWIVNIILPALIGSFFVFRLRFFRNNF